MSSYPALQHTASSGGPALSRHRWRYSGRSPTTERTPRSGGPVLTRGGAPPLLFDALYPNQAIAPVDRRANVTKALPRAGGSALVRHLRCCSDQGAMIWQIPFIEERKT